MALFKSKFKKIEPQNISVVPQSIPEAPKVIEPKMPSPVVISEITRAVVQNMSQQPTELSIANKELDKKISNKIDELLIEKRAIERTLEILRGI